MATSARPTGMAHVFCDESGGTDAVNTVFLTAAVAIAPPDAARLLKSFRKATRITGEVKGHKLTFEQRTIFVDLLTKDADAASAVVACSRSDAVGAWAMGALTEAELYRHLLAEACLILPGLGWTGQVKVTPDQPRYKKAQAESVRAGLTQAVIARHPEADIAVVYGNSTDLAGLQVADVIANSVFQTLAQHATADAAARLLAPLIARGVLRIQHVELEGTRPAWLTGV